VEEKKKYDSEFLSYNLMLNSGKKFSASRDKRNKYSNSCVVRTKISERNNPPFKLNGRSLSAIFKKGNKSLASNYRPVSLTSVVCKIMEKLVRFHILNHMKSQNLFTKTQYGFTSGRSTSLQLLEVLDKWTETLDNGHYVDCIYMDFQKAFDKVPHKRLLEKIKSYGIIGPTLNWIEDFLKK
jgi:hypothetical protein